MNTKVASVPFDRLQNESVLRNLYLWNGLCAFVAAVTLPNDNLNNPDSPDIPATPPSEEKELEKEIGEIIEDNNPTSPSSPDHPRLYRLGDALGCCR